MHEQEHLALDLDRPLPPREVLSAPPDRPWRCRVAPARRVEWCWRSRLRLPASRARGSLRIALAPRQNQRQPYSPRGRPPRAPTPSGHHDQDILRGRLSEAVHRQHPVTIDRAASTSVSMYSTVSAGSSASTKKSSFESATLRSTKYSSSSSETSSSSSGSRRSTRRTRRAAPLGCARQALPSSPPFGRDADAEADGQGQGQQVHASSSHRVLPRFVVSCSMSDGPTTGPVTGTRAPRQMGPAPGPRRHAGAPRRSTPAATQAGARRSRCAAWSPPASATRPTRLGLVCAPQRSAAIRRPLRTANTADGPPNVEVGRPRRGAARAALVGSVRLR